MHASFSLWAQRSRFTMKTFLEILIKSTRVHVVLNNTESYMYVIIYWSVIMNEIILSDINHFWLFKFFRFNIHVVNYSDFLNLHCTCTGTVHMNLPFLYTCALYTYMYMYKEVNCINLMHLRSIMAF